MWNSGSWSEGTYRVNTESFGDIKLREHVAVDMSDRTLARIIAGLPAARPVALALTGLTDMQQADGEILAARAGVPRTLSTMNICSIGNVVAESPASS